MTGSNKGIGFAIVKELCAEFDGVVYLTSRNEELGRAAVSELEKLGLHPLYHQLDIDDESSILNLRDFLKSNYGGLDVLVNNAALGNLDDLPLHESAIRTLGTNYFGTRAVSQLLFPLLRPGARVVNISSSLCHLSMVPGQQLRNKLSSADLTDEDLDNLMRQFIEQVSFSNLYASILMF